MFTFSHRQIFKKKELEKCMSKVVFQRFLLQNQTVLLCCRILKLLNFLGVALMIINQRKLIMIQNGKKNLKERKLNIQLSSYLIKKNIQRHFVDSKKVQNHKKMVRNNNHKKNKKKMKKMTKFQKNHNKSKKKNHNQVG